MRFAIALLLAGCGGSGGGGGGGQDGGAGSNPDFGGNLAACPVFPGDNPWNSDVSSAPVDPKSSQYLASIGMATGLHADFDAVGDGIPFVLVPGSQPKVPIMLG